MTKIYLGCAFTVRKLVLQAAHGRVSEVWLKDVSCRNGKFNQTQRNICTRCSCRARTQWTGQIALTSVYLPLQLPPLLKELVSTRFPILTGLISSHLATRVSQRSATNIRQQDLALSQCQVLPHPTGALNLTTNYKICAGLLEWQCFLIWPG